MSAENNEEVVVVERDLVVVENDEIVLEIVEIEEYVREGRPVPKARMYRYRVNKQKFDTDKEEITGAEILERAGLVPVKDYRLRKKRRHGPPEEVKPEEIVHLREHGVERFVAQHKHVQDGRGGRSEFAVGEEDRDFLDGLGLKWEALKVPVPNGPGPRLWIVIYQVPIPGGFNVSVADVAIEIAPGYPSAQLDMASFNPPLALRTGRTIACVQAVEKIDGLDWQRWSRHRTGSCVWKPGVDNLESHFAYVQDWLVRELGQ
jgi:hypothetical protein